jgi:hypothetical protein
MLRSGGPSGASKEAEPVRSSRMRTLPPAGLRWRFLPLLANTEGSLVDAGGYATLVRSRVHHALQRVPKHRNFCSACARLQYRPGDGGGHRRRQPGPATRYGHRVEWNLNHRNSRKAHEARFDRSHPKQKFRICASFSRAVSGTGSTNSYAAGAEAVCSMTRCLGCPALAAEFPFSI